MRRYQSAIIHPTVLGAAAAVLVACSQSRPSQTGELPWTTYDVEARPILMARCAGCHSGDAASGGYAVDSYAAVVARRDDGTPRISAGDANSPLLTAANGGRPNHNSLPQAERDVLADWVVRSHVAKQPYTVHLKGWMDPGNFTEFHGRLLRATGYSFDECTNCHGQDLRGGTSKVDCNSCHARGVLACNTCHGDATSAAPPRDLDGIRSTTSIGVGAHRQHVTARVMPGSALTDGPVHAAFSCSACHSLQPEHYRNAASPDARPVKVSFQATAGTTASWDRSNATCLSSHCHAPSTNDTRATHPPLLWNVVGNGAAGCGTCHGVPPSSHVDNRCPVCHQQAFAGGLLIPERHVNGVVELGNGGPGCSGCHGDSTSSAPPTDLLGRSDERLQTVGAHRAHLEARHQLRGPIECTECHSVPSDLHSPGHIDHLLPAVVFPNVPGVGVLARADGAQPAYNAATASCGSVYCHGAGNLAATDMAPSRVLNPSWTAGTSQIVCGACHGIPPVNDAHRGVTSISQCVNCHAATMDGLGIRITRDPITGRITSTHIDGVVQLGGP